MTQQQRPNSVPEGAQWDEDDNEWVVGTRNPDGEFIGLVDYYRPDGTLCCKTNFVDGTPHGEFHRFHENGEPSRSGVFVEGALHGTNRFVRSTADTTENFPRGLGDAIWTCDMDYAHGNVIEGRLYDQQGRRVMESGEPFPETRPHGVPDDAHFRKPADRDEYCWVSGASRTDEDNDVVRLGMWRTWNASGELLAEEEYDDNGQRVYARPAGVAPQAEFDEEEELWTESRNNDQDEAHGEQRSWDEEGRLRRIETYNNGRIERVQELLEDNTWAQDSTYIHDGVPQRKWLRRNEVEELDSFPNVCGEHPTAREVEYLFDPHGMMTGFKITDGGGAELESETLYRNAANDTEQLRFDSIEAVSQAWIAEGDQYTKQLNSWLAELYDSGEPSEEEPTFDDDLERATVEAVEALNLRGEGHRVRELFPRYYDGIGGGFWHTYGLVVDSVLHGGNAVYGRVCPPSGKPYIMGLADGKITKVPDVIAMGSSRDKEYLAWAYENHVTVVGTVGKSNFTYPLSYSHAAADALGTKALGNGETMRVRDIRVLAGGKEIILVSAEGIYLLREGGTSQRLYPLDAEMDTYVEHYDGDRGDFDLEMNFPNSDVSPDGTLITCGGMFRRGNMASLAIWSYQNGALALKNTSQADAFFPMQATFHRESPHIAFAATLYASLSNALTNTTFRIDLDDLEDGEIEGFGGGIAQEGGVVNVVASFGKGFLLGYDNGYVRWMGVEENVQLLGYLFVGGSVRHIDVSPDQESFVVASDSGLVAEYRMGQGGARNLVTTMPVQDVGCAAFFRTFEPMIW